MIHFIIQEKTCWPVIWVAPGIQLFSLSTHFSSLCISWSKFKFKGKSKQEEKKGRGKEYSK